MISVFISYAHKDERLKERFLVHLGSLKRQRLIGVWHDRMLRPGEHLDGAIEAELAAAELVILLISPDFINSDYCTEKEMQRAFARAKDGRCKVVPVILKPSLWRDIPIDNEGGRLGDFVALPHDGEPVTRSRHGRDAALDTVIADIRRLIIDKSAPGTLAIPTVQVTSPATAPNQQPVSEKLKRWSRIAKPCQWRGITTRLQLTSETFQKLKTSVTQGLTATREQFEKHPELIQLATEPRGFCLVAPLFPLPDGTLVDFALFSTPQWYQIDFVLVAEPGVRPFSSDGTPTQELQRATSLAQKIRTAYADDKMHFSNGFSEMILTKQEEIKALLGPDTAGFLHPSSMAGSLRRGDYSFRTIFIIMGRREMYGPEETQGRRVWMDTNPVLLLLSYDYVLEKVGPYCP
jgi:hypothetical protein